MLNDYPSDHWENPYGFWGFWGRLTNVPRRFFSSGLWTKTGVNEFFTNAANDVSPRLTCVRVHRAVKPSTFHRREINVSSHLGRRTRVSAVNYTAALLPRCLHFGNSIVLLRISVQRKSPTSVPAHSVNPTASIFCLRASARRFGCAPEEEGGRPR